ncbi:hypothetical protein [Actinobaculum massiliense]|nr:hypothetical protein [Actinobaculum massiliense]MDK8318755.1 hypothetical protein [Actinobaculum massiliense]MDK8566409.1 hypothetical protein [Actinobaculum massiliense]
MRVESALRGRIEPGAGGGVVVKDDAAAFFTYNPREKKNFRETNKEIL